MRKTLALLLGPALLLASACATRDTAPPTQSPSAQVWPEGREFVATSVRESGVERPLVAGTTLLVRFGAPFELHVNAGCNQIGVRARLDGDRIVPDDYVSTAMGCDQDRLAQDAWVVAFFTSEPEWQLTGGELRLETDSTEIRLTER
jgi:heat shock protein HslJ